MPTALIRRAEQGVANYHAWWAAIEQVSAALDRVWIQQALTTTGKATVRRRKLPAGRALGPCRTGEVTWAETLWDKIPDDSLTLLDRGFLSYGPLHRLQTKGSSWHGLIRAKVKLKWRTIRRLVAALGS